VGATAEISASGPPAMVRTSPKQAGRRSGESDGEVCRAGVASYMSSTRSTSRLRKLGGPSHRAASCDANSLVSGRFELAIASS
jgi:hypothetical protein